MQEIFKQIVLYAQCLLISRENFCKFQHEKRISYRWAGIQTFLSARPEVYDLTVMPQINHSLLQGVSLKHRTIIVRCMKCQYTYRFFHLSIIRERRYKSLANMYAMRPGKRNVAIISIIGYLYASGALKSAYYAELQLHTLLDMIERVIPPRFFR